MDGLAAHQRTVLGLARSFQLPRPFHSLSVADNLRVPLLYAVKARSGIASRRRANSTTTASNISASSGSTTRRSKQPRDLTQVEMRKLELARAMAAEPKLLIADESMAGLSHSEIEDILKLLVRAQRARHHHHPDRAHHERGDELLAAARRAGVGQEDRGRRPAGGRAQPRGGEGPTLANSIAISGVHAGLRRGPRARGRVARRARRPRPWCCSAPTATARAR